jgi:AraC-like DNA-binding protein
MTYREHTSIGPWRDDVGCAWTSVSGSAVGELDAVIPDGCTDVLWSSTRGAVVVGPMTRPVVPQFPPGTEHVALRLRPGHAERVLGVPPSALTDLTVPLDDVVGAAGRALDGRLGAAAGTAERLAVLHDLPGLAPAAEVDRVALASLSWLVARPDRHVEQAAHHVGLSARQLQRRVVAAIGYGPKRLQRVVRVQRVLAVAQAWTGDLARLAATLGFSDQAHLAREVRQLTGRPPTAVLGARATLVSGTSKPGDRSSSMLPVRPSDAAALASSGPGELP